MSANPQTRCKDCDTPMDDAGAGIGLYCPSSQCPGIARSRAWAREQLDAQRERESIAFLRSRGFVVRRESRTGEEHADR